jgi:hypothetical protein
MPTDANRERRGQVVAVPRVRCSASRALRDFALSGISRFLAFRAVRHLALFRPLLCLNQQKGITAQLPNPDVVTAMDIARGAGVVAIGLTKIK